MHPIFKLGSPFFVCRNKVLDVPYKPDVFSSISMSIDASGTRQNEESLKQNGTTKQNGEIDFSSIEHSLTETTQVNTLIMLIMSIIIYINFTNYVN